MKNSHFFKLFMFLICILGSLTLLYCEEIGNEKVNQFSSNQEQECTRAKKSNLVECGKRYIPQDKIVLIDNSILVEIEDQIYETSAIYNDEHGFFIQGIKVDYERCGWSQWECQVCGYCNFQFDRCCLVCEHDKKGKRCK